MIRTLTNKWEFKMDSEKSTRIMILLSGIVIIALLHTQILQLLIYFVNALFWLCWNAAGWLDKIIWGVKVR